jgi:hypothetical protein
MDPPGAPHDSPSADTNSARRLAERRKSVLFCPQCDHQALIGGDWVVHESSHGDTREIRCPECATTLTERPSSDSPYQSTIESQLSEVLGETFSTVTDLWTASVQFWLSWPPRRADS